MTHNVNMDHYVQRGRDCLIAGVCWLAVCVIAFVSCARQSPSGLPVDVAAYGEEGKVALEQFARGQATEDDVFKAIVLPVPLDAHEENLSPEFARLETRYIGKLGVLRNGLRRPNWTKKERSVLRLGDVAEAIAAHDLLVRKPYVKGQSRVVSRGFRSISQYWEVDKQHLEFLSDLWLSGSGSTDSSPVWALSNLEIYWLDELYCVGQAGVDTTELVESVRWSDLRLGQESQVAVTTGSAFDVEVWLGDTVGLEASEKLEQCRSQWRDRLWPWTFDVGMAFRDHATQIENSLRQIVRSNVTQVPEGLEIID